jgi:hypothetical protein
MARIALSVLALGACVTPPPPNHDDGGQSGVANVPATCVEDGRVVVTDLDVPAEGFAFAPSIVAERVLGAWTGAADLDGTGDVAVSVDVTLAGDVVAVSSHLEGGSDDTNTDALGAPSQSCPMAYEFELALAIDASPVLLADVPAPWTVAASEGPDGFAGSVPAEEVDGTLRPPEWPEPDLWDREALSASFAATPSSGGGPAEATLFLEWSAFNDDAAAAAGTATSTGVAEPSGISEAIASVPLTR